MYQNKNKIAIIARNEATPTTLENIVVDKAFSYLRAWSLFFRDMSMQYSKYNEITDH